MEFFTKKSKMEVEKITPTPIQIGRNDYYITKILRLKNGVVNVATKDNKQVDFDENGKIFCPISNNAPAYSNIVYLEYLPFEKNRWNAAIANKQFNDYINKDFYYSLFNDLLSKFDSEIYVIINEFGWGCYTFDKDKKYQGLFTFYDTGYGYKNCQISYKNYSNSDMDAQKNVLRMKKNELVDAQAFYDAPLRRLESAKMNLKLYEQKVAEDNQEFNKKWGYLLK